VVGDPDQTIYTFAGADPEFLLGFAGRHPGAQVVTLPDNYRSTPQILELANRLTAGGVRGALVATRPDGPPPSIVGMRTPGPNCRPSSAGFDRSPTRACPRRRRRSWFE
jgi:superfamily I DNA/RNA helicase